MAGNSLAEAVVFGRRAAIAMARDEAKVAPPPDEDDDDVSAVRTIREGDWDRLRAAMSDGAGLVRTKDSLNEAMHVVEEISRTANKSLRAAAVAAGLICRSALERDESRGVHFRADMPEPSRQWEARHVTLRPE
jgi:L-aspartate oxidase